MSRARFSLWMRRAAADVLSEDQVRLLTSRFLEEAANDVGGERVYVPSTTSKRTEKVRLAIRMADAGYSFQECREVLGDELSQTTFYRWRREKLDTKQVRMAAHEARRKHLHGGFIYALGFHGADDGERAVKLGLSHSPATRAQTISGTAAMQPVEIALLSLPAYTDEAKSRSVWLPQIERECHLRLDYCRLDGEWFNPRDWLDEAATVMEEVASVFCDRFMLHRF